VFDDHRTECHVAAQFGDARVVGGAAAYQALPLQLDAHGRDVLAALTHQLKELALLILGGEECERD